MLDVCQYYFILDPFGFFLLGGKLGRSCLEFFYLGFGVFCVCLGVYFVGLGVILEVVFIPSKGRNTVSPSTVQAEGWSSSQQLLRFYTHAGPQEIRCSNRKE